MHEFPRRSGAAQPVTLDQVLQTKEERAAVQAELRSRYQAAVVSVSVNMPGTVKYDQDTLALIEYALARLQKLFAIEGFQTLESRWLHAVAGPAAVFAVAGDAAAIKLLAVKVEQEQPFGRLLDIDVFDAGGSSSAAMRSDWVAGAVLFATSQRFCASGAGGMKHSKLQQRWR